MTLTRERWRLTLRLWNYTSSVIVIGLTLCSVVPAQDTRKAPLKRKDLELFLLIGQSNMAGRGAVETWDQQPLPNVFVLDKEMRWIPATDPLHYDSPKIVGAGLGRSFAKTLLIIRPSAVIGLIPAAVGGASLDQWQPEGALFRDAVTRAREALKSGTLRAILWHQGESDAQKQELSSTYSGRFVEFIRSLRQELGSGDVPVLVGQLGEFTNFPFASSINEQLALLPLKVPNCAFVSSAGLRDKGDQVHFNTSSLREFGRRYAIALFGLEPAWMALDLTGR